MTIADAPQRQQAIDVLSSFCVTAPAGSGKTELLIQRFLALLTRVEKPEQVLAITFTRKAAAEMRERVLIALQSASTGEPCEGEHELVTRELALAALSWGLQQGWRLTRDIARLNIKTIDSFCAGLTRQMPVLSQFGGQAKALDDARALYREAVDGLFSLVDSARPEAKDIAQLILHFDNNWDRLRELLVTMLARRDQWHEYLGNHGSPQEAEAHLHATVEAVINEVLLELSPQLDPFQDELLDLLCYAQGNLERPLPDDFPLPQAGDAESWRQLRALLLTQAGTWRKSVNVKNGFPPGKGEKQERKDHFKHLVARLSEIPGLEAELHALGWLPDMSDNSDSWRMVVHLSHVLPLLSACLLLVFQRRGVVDHSQVALSALQALGDEDNPTELALRLDYQIEHILVDEFQDTAINQYRLVGRLTRGWGQHNAINPQAPRTIFIVGDGMQSIYGFRDANVGLFLKAQREGFNGVVPVGLALCCNFRSDEALVQWVNSSFREAFPEEENVRRGRVRFTEAVPVRPALAGAGIAMHAFTGEQAAVQEASLLLGEIHKGLNDNAVSSIAVLGRSRNHLAALIDLLRAEAIPYAAQEMAPLAGSAVITDLMILCRALANPADKVAWFALLRSPLCGLELSDLYILQQAGEGGRFSNMARVLMQEPPGELSSYGTQQLQCLARCLRWARLKRDRLALRVWIEQLWLMLGGAAAASEPGQLLDARQFFGLLQRSEQEGVGLDVDWLHRQLERLYAGGDTPDVKLQLMTLHKAKGLEFDWVIIPALGNQTRGDSRDLLLWDEYNSPSGERGFLLAADDHGDDSSPSLYNFLKRQRREKSRLEVTRLLYVGATRAVKRLLLSARLESEDNDDPTALPVLKDPSDGSLLAPIWPVFREQMTVHSPVVENEQVGKESGRCLLRLTNASSIEPLLSEREASGDNIPVRALNRFERHVGTVIHQALEELSLMQALPDSITKVQGARWRHALATLGLHGELLQRAWEAVETAVVRTLADERSGRWLLSSAHQEAYSELALTQVDEQGGCRDIIIDRTFIDASTGLRWIVDYKSSSPAPDETQEDFAAREAMTYAQQLRDYRDALSSFGPQPLRCALYFTSIARLQVLP